MVGLASAFSPPAFIAQDPDPRESSRPAAIRNSPIHRLARRRAGREGDAKVLHSGDEVFPASWLRLRAKTRINFETCICKDGEIGERLSRRSRARPSAALMRWCRSGRIADEAEEPDRLKAGASCRFNPLGFFTVEVANYRTHRKTLVVDGEVAFTGGLGVADYWLGHAQDRDHWRDTHFKVTGPAVRSLEASFYENWIETGGLSAPALDPELAPRPTGARSIVVWSNPMSGASNIKLMYLLAIGAARKNIDIQSPYITLDSSTQWSLEQARRRGVRVRMLAEGDVTDAMPVKHASRYRYQELLDQGVEIAEYQPTMMHTKAFMVDGVFSIIGSANFGNRSFELNDELAVGVLDRACVEADDGLRQRPEGVETSGQGYLDAPALVRWQTQRVVLELLRRDLLARPGPARMRRCLRAPSRRSLAAASCPW